MGWIPDASVASKWHLKEDYSAAAKALLRDDPVTLAPDSLMSEFGNAVSRNIRRGKFPAEKSGEAMAEMAVQISEFTSVHALVVPAVKMSVELNHAIYDCLYLALAVREGAILVTDDQKFFRKVAASRWRDHIANLRDYDDAKQ